MTKYYCPDCKTEYKTSWILHLCPLCNGYVTEVPERETIPQWEARHGKPYPANGLVWVREKCFGIFGSWYTEWKLYEYEYILRKNNINREIIAVDEFSRPEK